MEKVYGRPEEWPATLVAADEKTTLNRYKIEGLIYARTRKEAQERLRQAATYLDAGKIVD
jgi:hypothetical protein